MLAPVPGKFGPAGIPEFEVFDLPYMFPDLDALQRIYDGPAGAALLKKLEAKGMVGLAYWNNGFRVMSANRPIHVPADMKGLKMRINSSKVNAAIMKSVAAVPDDGVFRGVPGAADRRDRRHRGPAVESYTQKQYEVQKHVRS